MPNTSCPQQVSRLHISSVLPPRIERPHGVCVGQLQAVYADRRGVLASGAPNDLLPAGLS